MFDQLQLSNISGVHRPPEEQGRNGVTRAQSWMGVGGGVGVYGFGPPRLRVGDMAKISLFFFLNMFHDFIDSLSCLFFYFASCLSITAKLISLL